MRRVNDKWDITITSNFDCLLSVLQSPKFTLRMNETNETNSLRWPCDDGRAGAVNLPLASAAPKRGFSYRWMLNVRHQDRQLCITKTSNCQVGGLGSTARKHDVLGPQIEQVRDLFARLFEHSSSAPASGVGAGRIGRAALLYGDKLGQHLRQHRCPGVEVAEPGTFSRLAQRSTRS